MTTFDERHGVFETRSIPGADPASRARRGREVGFRPGHRAPPGGGEAELPAGSVDRSQHG